MYILRCVRVCVAGVSKKEGTSSGSTNKKDVSSREKGREREREREGKRHKDSSDDSREERGERDRDSKKHTLSLHTFHYLHI